MHRLAILAASATCLAFTDCKGGKDDSAQDGPYTRDNIEQNAAIACVGYTNSVTTTLIGNICADNDEFFEQYEAADALAVILDECVAIIVASDDWEGSIYVAQATCALGYQVNVPSGWDDVEDLECADVTDDDYDLTWPHDVLCPCLDDGRYVSVGDSTVCDKS
jgi:hypothetical protein